MNEVQRRWQAAALEVLLGESGKFDVGPWVPTWHTIEEIRKRANCTPQAATGALRALRTVGLAETIGTGEGSFWKATDAAARMFDLVLWPLIDELAAIGDRLEGIDANLDQILWLQEMRERVEAAR